ncbi:hypothetical protein SCUCBS95973_008653 [Sporothrix curviconia]|uniref:Uncharacterized protein n=1 Tax=Sporothrix curviconia TaxID=1260050 RepID=A0ABP0CR98_9PEZI
MIDYSPSSAVNSGSSNAAYQSAKPAEPTGIAGLPPKPVFGDSTVKTDSVNGDVAAKKSESPLGGFSSTADKKDDVDFPKPVTPVSEANGRISGSDNTYSNKPPAAAAAALPLPLTEPAPAEVPKPAEPAAVTPDWSSTIPTANAPSVTLAAPTMAPSANGEPSSLTAGLSAKPVETAEPPSLTTTNVVAGEKRKADESVDVPAAEKANNKPADPPLTALFGTGTVSSSLFAKPPAVEPEAVVGLESPSKKLKTDTSAEVASAPAAAEPVLPLAASAAAVGGTPTGPPISVPAPAPVTVPAKEPAPASDAAPVATFSSLEVNVGPAPSAEDIASASMEAPAKGVKKSNSRAKREKKPLPPVGKTARKTRSQGPVN